MAGLTYNQVLADLYDETPKLPLVLPNIHEHEIHPEDKLPDEIEDQHEFQKEIGSHQAASLMKQPAEYTDKTKLGIRYDKDVKTHVLSIDSRFRSDPLLVSNSNFIHKFSRTFKNIISVRVSGVEIPNSFYAFSSARGNTSCLITYGGNTRLISLSTPTQDGGNYDALTLCSSLQTLINAAFMSSAFSVTVDVNISGRVTISTTNGIPFAIDFGSANPRIADFGLGYNLGFRQKTYTGLSSYISESIIDVTDTDYLFLNLEPDWKVVTHETPDRTQLFSFAKIIINVPKNDLIIDNGSNTITKEYFFQQPSNISSLPVRLSDPYDQDIDLMGMDFSFTLELKEILNSELYETLRT